MPFCSTTHSRSRHLGFRLWVSCVCKRSTDAAVTKSVFAPPRLHVSHVSILPSRKNAPLVNTIARAHYLASFKRIIDNRTFIIFFLCGFTRTIISRTFAISARVSGKRTSELFVDFNLVSAYRTTQRKRGQRITCNAHKKKKKKKKKKKCSVNVAPWINFGVEVIYFEMVNIYVCYIYIVTNNLIRSIHLFFKYSCMPVDIRFVRNVFTYCGVTFVIFAFFVSVNVDSMNYII